MELFIRLIASYLGDEDNRAACVAVIKIRKNTVHCKRFNQFSEDSDDIPLPNNTN